MDCTPSTTWTIGRLAYWLSLSGIHPFNMPQWRHILSCILTDKHLIWFTSLCYSTPVRCLRTLSHMSVNNWMMPLSKEHWWLLLVRATELGCVQQVTADLSWHMDVWPIGHKKQGRARAKEACGFNRVNHHLFDEWQIARSAPVPPMATWIDCRPVQGPPTERDHMWNNFECGVPLSQQELDLLESLFSDESNDQVTHL